MSRYNTGIGDNIPSVLDLGSAVSSFLSDFVQVILGQANTSFAPASLEDQDPGAFDPATRSWEGPEGLRYRVPLYPIPSERRAREKTRNIKIMMDNCRRLCMNDDLPCTKEEKKFWASYRFMKYELYLAPFCVIVPPVYVFAKIFQNNLPRLLRGRFMPILFGAALAEVWADETYPGHQLLNVTLRAKTPMGDAARAEWARVQSLEIPLYLFSSYQFHSLTGTVRKEFQFGGDLASLCG
ncbi:hypothetical protein AGDE_00536 [Angomonas deanei]|uniref:Uncharacterized protein n=1 Tax=Angomonas deanei TaxID=59799 RepID=S9WYS3_9TRYP|nr:hypothetical protein AGDE_10936 [Angomonas deanei]EPY41235.1 hypothetical protein AGDE_02690 [Angomonas deanei]EPY43385.1 hypothetical protein AGDE_00536 [Angomonas deanei]CAD2213173.1 hypothetical protein, conserved [Angomonas deanei]|eukprot:EPY27097.1 hypothetical protein AGDE_10936 [Angomonas deanei]